MGRTVEAEDVVVAVVADVHGATAVRASLVEDIEFPESEVDVFGPAIGPDWPPAVRSLDVPTKRKPSNRQLLASCRAIVLLWVFLVGLGLISLFIALGILLFLFEGIIALARFAWHGRAS